MKISKQTAALSNGICDNEQIRIIAREIAKVFAEELKAVLSDLSLNTSSQRMSNYADTGVSKIEIDESVIDVGVSTMGLTKGTAADLATETVSDDNVSRSSSKLKALKKRS